eukprot:14521362-Ditylum_brightwellii.AAC.1
MDLISSIMTAAKSMDKLAFYLCTFALRLQSKGKEITEFHLAYVYVYGLDKQNFESVHLCNGIKDLNWREKGMDHALSEAHTICSNLIANGN